MVEFGEDGVVGLTFLAGMVVLGVADSPLALRFRFAMLCILCRMSFCILDVEVEKKKVQELGNFCRDVQTCRYHVVITLGSSPSPVCTSCSCFINIEDDIRIFVMIATPQIIYLVLSFWKEKLQNFQYRTTNA